MVSEHLVGNTISHHNECQSKFPSGCMFRAFFSPLKYWHSKIVSKVSPWDLGLSWMCHLISVIVAEGPKVCIGLCPHTLIAKGERCQGTVEKLWHTGAGNKSSSGFYLARCKGNVKKQEGFSLSQAAVFDPPHCIPHSHIMQYEKKQRRELRLCCQFCWGRILIQKRT